MFTLFRDISEELVDTIVQTLKEGLIRLQTKESLSSRCDVKWHLNQQKDR